MASNIDPTQPPASNPTTAAMRANMAAAKAEIEALQAMRLVKGSVLANFPSNVMLTGGNVLNDINYTAEEYDDLGSHSTSVDPYLFTVPAGCSGARGLLMIDTLSAPETSILTIEMWKNGLYLSQLFQQTINGGQYLVSACPFAEMRLSPGDTLQFKARWAGSFLVMVGSTNRAAYAAIDWMN